MKRLTERDEYGNADIVGVDSVEWQGYLGFESFNRVTEALNLLARYEDLEEQGQIVNQGVWLASEGEDPEIVQCSECRHVICKGDYYKRKAPPYCEMCGAKMIEDKA